MTEEKNVHVFKEISSSMKKFKAQNTSNIKELSAKMSKLEKSIEFIETSIP